MHLKIAKVAENKNYSLQKILVRLKIWLPCMSENC